MNLWTLENHTSHKDTNGLDLLEKCKGKEGKGINLI